MYFKCKMPIKYRSNFSKKCSDDPAARLRTPGCAVRVKPFEPHSRTKVKKSVTGNPGTGKTENENETEIGNGNGNVVTPSEEASDNRESATGPQIAGIRLQYISDAQRQAHLMSIKKFAEHPDATPRDIFAGELAQAAYINDPNVMDEYINNVSSIGEKGYILDTDINTQNTYMKTFVNPQTGDVAVAYRGTVDWLGQDGAANVTNTFGLTKVRQFISDEMDVDLRARKATQVNETNRYIQSKYPGRVTLTAGHSQGGHDATQAKKQFFQDAESIVFMPAPGGEVKKGEGKMWTTPNDIVSAKGKLYSMFSQNYNTSVMRSTDPSLLNTITMGHMSDNFAPPVPDAAQESTGESWCNGALC